MREFKVGQRAWSPLTGWGIVGLCPGSPTYPLLHNGVTYTEDGKSNKTNLRPTLFHNEVPESKWPNPEPPLPNLEVDAKIWVRCLGHTNWLPRHFHKWDEHGKGVWFWEEGRTSFTGSVTVCFPLWRLDDGRTNCPNE